MFRAPLIPPIPFRFRRQIPTLEITMMRVPNRMHSTSWQITFFTSLAIAAAIGTAERSSAAPLKAGAIAIDISPAKFPVYVNGAFTARTADKVVDPLHARAIVLD